MSVLRRIKETIQALFGQRQLDAQMDEELRFHIDKETEKNIRLGMAPAEAHRQAKIAFGGVERFREQAKEERGVRPLENLVLDGRYALRQLRKSPGFAVVSVLTLALGIGATTLVFSVFNTVVLRPLPFEDAHRLVRIRELTPQGQPMSVADANFLDFREQSRSFQEMAAVFNRPLILSQDGEPAQVNGMAATQGLFAMLGVTPEAGRSFSATDFRVGEEPQTVILGNGFWSRRFGSDPGLVGETVFLDGMPRMVAGILPPLDPPFQFDVWLPYAADPNYPRNDHRREVFARLAPGVSADQALDDLNQIQARLGESFPESNFEWQVWLRTLPEWVVGPQVTRIAQVLLVAVGLLLVLACVSVSNLLVARGTARQREISLRAALGAGRSRLLSQLLMESLVLAALGAGLGIVLASWTLPLVQALESTPLPRLDQVTLDRTVLLFASAATILSALVFGVAPALQGSRADLMDLLRTGGRMASLRTRRFRQALVAGQLALAMILLIGAGLLVNSFMQMAAVDPGFESENLLMVQLSLPADRYPEMSPQVNDAYRSIISALENTPGISAAGATMASAISGARPANFVARADRSAAQEDFVPVGFRPVTPGFFRAMGIPLQAGELFEDLQTDALMEGALAGDEVQIPMVVSQSLAALLWPERDPVGESVIWNQPGGSPMYVAAVVGDVRDLSFPMDARPSLYLPHRFVAWPSMTLVIRTTGSPGSVAGLVREAVWSVDPALPVPEITVMENALGGALAAPRLNMVLLGIFSGSALLLAAVALYGITAFSVSRRSREIGVRLALGAPKAEVVGMVMKGAAVLIALGGTVGLAGAFLLSRFLESLLFGVGTTDFLTYGVVTVVLAMVTLMATLLPARKALKINPTAALQAD